MPKAPPTRGCKSLDEAISRTWQDDPLGEEELGAFKDRLAADLADGSFTFVVAAQRFTDPMATTARYLNATHRASSFSLVEMVRFANGSSEEVFEARTVLRPQVTGPPAPPTRLTRESLKEALGETAYGKAVERIIDEAEARGLLVTWGKTGLSIRLPSAAGKPPVSVGWLFPPGVIGWLGLTDLVLGVDPTAPGYAMFRERIDAFSERVGNLGGIPVTNGGLRAQGFSAICDGGATRRHLGGARAPRAER